MNLDANDDHHKAVQLMIGTKSLTSYEDCSPCCHPKLFHASAAAIQLMFKLTTYEAQIRSGQFLNPAMGVLLLLLLWIWIQSHLTIGLVLLMAVSIFESGRLMIFLRISG